MSVIAGHIFLDAAVPASGAGLDVWSADRRWRLAWSGRLDNRGDFARRFSLSPHGGDAQLAADAIAARGIVALGTAIGDFALVAWDTVERRLWLARDAIGFRPLFYLHEREQVWFATERRWLTRGAARGRPIHEGYIAEFLSGAIVDVAATPTVGVCRVLPATALGFTFGAASPTRLDLWRPPTVLPPPRSDADLIAEFRDRFAVAVSRAVGGATTFSTQLSGGLDSTAVTAAVKSTTGRAPDAYSLVYPSVPVARDGEMLDESLYIDAAVAAIGSRSIRFDPLGPGGLRREDFSRVTTCHDDLPDFPVTDALSYALFTRAAADGHQVMLTGIGGDYWLTGSLSRLPQLIRRGQWLDAWSFGREARRPDTLAATTSQFRAHLLARLTPPWIKSVYRRARLPRGWPSWLPDEFTARVQLGARRRRLSARVPKVDDDVLQDSLLTLTLGDLLLARESVFRAAADAGIDVRHPMLDREFVEFVITLPDDLRLRDTETRYILRRALGDWLPPMIRERRSKGDGSTVITAATSMLLGGRTSFGSLASSRGWIDADRLWPRLQSLSLRDYREHLPAEGDDHLWSAVAVETWLAERGA